MADVTSNTDSIAINEVQLILAEKRTSLAVMRTGIAILALPLSVTSLLIATSKYYDVLDVLHLLIPLTIVNLALVLLALYLIAKSIAQQRKQDRHILQIKQDYSLIKELIE